MTARSLPAGSSVGTVASSVGSDGGSDGQTQPAPSRVGCAASGPTRADLDRLTGWAAARYPKMWRDDPDEVRSAVGWALASGRRIEWVLDAHYRDCHRQKRSGPVVVLPHTPPAVVDWDGRVSPGEPRLDAHLVEWYDPTGEQAASRVDAASTLTAVHPEYRQVLWAYALGGTPTEVAAVLGRPLNWVRNVVYPSNAGGNAGVDVFSQPKGAVAAQRSRAAAARDERRRRMVAAAAAGLAAGRSLRQVAHDLTVPRATLTRVWREHCAGLEGVAA